MFKPRSSALTAILLAPALALYACSPASSGPTPTASTDAMMAEKTSDAMMAQKTAEAMMTQKTSEAMMAEKTTEAMMAQKTAEAMTAEKTSEAMMAQKTSEAMMAEKTTEATMAQKTAEAMTTKTPEAMAKPTETAMMDQGMMAKLAWKQLEARNAPPARFDHALAFDPEQQRLILFGGRASGVVFGDTWIYELKTNEWREVKTQGPSPRFGMGAVYDPVKKAVLVFGGQDKAFYNDTWAFDTVAETWRELETSGDKPDIRYGHGTAFDTLNERLVISHGFAKGGRHDDTWVLDLKTNTWENITPQDARPLKRCLLEIAYAPASHALYLFGGCSSGFGPCPQGDLWMLDLHLGRWTEIKPPGDTPSPRENPALVVDEKGNRLILFGGKDSSVLNDLWIFDLAKSTWSQIMVKGPSARKSHDAVYDHTNHRIYLFGGNTENGAINDLWVLEL